MLLLIGIAIGWLTCFPLVVLVLALAHAAAKADNAARLLWERHSK